MVEKQNHFFSAWLVMIRQWLAMVSQWLVTFFMVNYEFLQFSQTLVLWTPTATSLRRNLYSRLLVVTWLQQNGKHLGEPSVGKAPLINSTDARFDIVDLRDLCEGIGSRTNRQQSQVRCDKLWFPLNRLRESRVHWSNISPQVGWSLVVTTARSFLSSKLNMIGVYIRTTATPHRGLTDRHMDHL